MVTSEFQKLAPEELTEAWPALSDEDRRQGFILLSDEEAEDFLSHLSTYDAVELITQLPRGEQRKWLRILPPDDLADIVQELPHEQQEALLGMLDEPARRETRALLQYDEDDAGGLMTPRYARLRENMTVTEAISYLRRQKSRNAELIYYAYVVDTEQRLVGVVSFRDLVISSPDRRVSELMTRDIVAIPVEMDQEEVSRVFAHEDLLCLPVVDEAGRMKGIVTADDIIDVAAEEATEDMHKIGGTEALEAPYLHVTLWEMLYKRGIWLVVLLLLGFLTVEAMSRFENTLAEVVALGLFVPLIISCGGNTGSQAATLVVRAMALNEVRPRDWWRVVQRELVVGVGLGLLLGITGMGATLLWNIISGAIDDKLMHLTIALSGSILCIVLWGTIAGSMLPFALRRCGIDPASASAPLVATLVDASGVVIYFSVTSLILRILGT